LFYHLLPTDEYVLPAGLFQDREFTLSREIFIDEKPGYYELKNDTRKMTGQQVFELFAPKSQRYVCCYPSETDYRSRSGCARRLFSAHGLPQR